MILEETSYVNRRVTKTKLEGQILKQKQLILCVFMVYILQSGEEPNVSSYR